MLLLDEPTSGLDAAAATSIMAFLRSLAKELNIVIITTIHQPSAKVYAGFDRVMVLAGGEVAYNGPAASLDGYLLAIGEPVPPGVSIAEHVLDLVNAEFSDPASVDRVVAHWRDRDAHRTVLGAHGRDRDTHNGSLQRHMHHPVLGAHWRDRDAHLTILGAH